MKRDNSYRTSEFEATHSGAIKLDQCFYKTTTNQTQSVFLQQINPAFGVPLRKLLELSKGFH